MIRRLVGFLALWLVVNSLSQLSNAVGQSTSDSSLDRAKQLWEMAIASKGGRDRLNALKSIAITQSFGTTGPSTELCVFPDKYWVWEDRRPTKLGLAAEVRNFETNISYFVVGHLPDNPSKSELKPESREPITQCQLLFLLESRWFRPALLRAYRAILGSKDVDVVEVRVDRFRVAVSLDLKTHLAVRIAYFSNYAADKVFQWFGLSDYREVKGILVPHSISYDGGRSVPVRVELDVEYDPSVFERPPRIADGPNQWRAKDSKTIKSIPSPQTREEIIASAQIRQALNQIQQADENLYIEGRDELLRVGNAAVPALVEAINHSRGELEYRLASTLLQIDDQNDTALNAIRRLLLDKSQDGLLRRQSAFDLASSNEGIAILIALMKDEDVFVRRSVMFAFDELTEQSEIPELAKRAVPVLKELTKDPDEIVRGMAEEVLGQISKKK